MDDVNLHLKAFGLKEQPFAPTADPAYFYATQEHKACLYQLWSSIDERHGIAVVLGNYGTGKTTLLRKLMTGMAADPEKYNTAVIGSPIPSWTSFSLLEAIIQQFGLSPEKRSFASYMESLNRYLIVNRERINTLIIDDAQNLNKRGQLELLRLAQNLETPQHKLLNLVLFAQLEWSRVLQAAPNFQQRVNMTYTLEPLSVEDVSQFIRFRLTHAGATEERTKVFQPDAIQLVHTFSEGNPRVIVTLCRNALLFAAHSKKNVVDREVVLHTIDKTTLPNSRKIALARGTHSAAQTQQPSRPAAPAAPAAQHRPQPATPLATETASSDSDIASMNELAQAPRETIIPATVERAYSNKANEMLMNAARKQNRE